MLHFFIQMALGKLKQSLFYIKFEDCGRKFLHKIHNLFRERYVSNAGWGFRWTDQILSIDFCITFGDMNNSSDEIKILIGQRQKFAFTHSTPIEKCKDGLIGKGCCMTDELLKLL